MKSKTSFNTNKGAEFYAEIYFQSIHVFLFFFARIAFSFVDIPNITQNLGFGVFAPLFFSHIGVDPAISAGPIVTSFNDFLSMTIYFVIAWGVSNLFF